MVPSIYNMEKNEILNIANKAIEELEKYLEKNKGYKNLEQKDALNVLFLIQKDITEGLIIHERLLRGYKDICTNTAIHHEDALYANSIFHLKDCLEQMYPEMKKLKLLGLDFGKGNPI